jgi:N-acetylglucosaminyldiphosphoundecaprenol N-acetyl-beta-D-mannosaminyltransferase
VQTEQFHGVDITLTTLDGAAQEFLQRAKTGTDPETYRLVNAYTFALARQSPDYLALLRGPGVNLPDGKPLAAVVDRLSTEVCSQVRGPSFFERCLDEGRALGVRHFFLGASDSTLAQLRRAVERRFPGVVISGVHSPAFRPLTDEDHRHHDELIRASGADVVWVGMGTPRQDFEARRITDSVGVTAAGVGAAFDFSAGVKRQAPHLLHRLGLEWLFRLATEPRRLGKRYLVGNTVFLRMAASEWSNRRRKRT